MIDTVYLRQAELLLRVLPLVDREAVFALKGGTAINFFIRDLPRVSVDIDLVYLPVGERDLSLREISAALVRISRDVESRIPGTKIVPKKILFGALHGRWPAGTVAGMFYAWAMYRRGKVSDAIMAHATKNALIAAEVLLFGNWTLWN